MSRRLLFRRFLNVAFSGFSLFSVIAMAAVLLLVLSPIVYRGLGAVFFYGTNEFREMQLEVFNRGDAERVRREAAEVEEARRFVYDSLERFRAGIDLDPLTDEVRSIYRDYGEHLRRRGVKGARYTALRGRAKALRDALIEAYESRDPDFVRMKLDEVLALKMDRDFSGTAIERCFVLAERYRRIAGTMDPDRRDQYREALAEVQDALKHLLGPMPGDREPALTLDRYGATRWDVARRELHRLVYVDAWVSRTPGAPLVKERVPRSEFFAGTELEPVFHYAENNLESLLRPRWTFYWRYFIDDSLDGHYFGGCGPEILGTLLLTVLSMLMAIPLGIASAAFLVECGGDNPLIRIIRTCVNTLAGVPSIVFGLFGMAFFVLYLAPLAGRFAQETLGMIDSGTAVRMNRPNILTAAMTLGLLALPVIIRASEEAIRAVPQTYKEAALALGAGQFRSFVSVILPAAAPGIITGIILSLSRAAGETAPILFTGAVAFGPIPKSLLDPTRALSYGSYDIAVGDRLSTLVPHNQYGMVMTLILLVLGLNFAAVWLRSRSSRKLRGG